MTQYVPYFSISNEVEETKTAYKIWNYLSQFDDNLKGDKVFFTMTFAKEAFKEVRAEDITLLRKTGQGLILDGYLPSSTLVDGFRAINRRGYYKIVGDPQLVNIPNNKGQIIPSWQAPVLFTEGEGKRVYADILNVGPLINEFGFGFDFEDIRNMHCFHKHSRGGDKESFLKALKNKVFYVLEQISIDAPGYLYRPKHTVWFIFPKSSMFFFQGMSEAIVTGSELLKLNRL